MELKALTAIHAASGDERALRKALVEEAKRFCEDVRIDRAGNVICHKKGTKDGLPRVLVSAHMDEVGFIVRSATDDGLLRIRPIGGIDPRVVVSKHVVVGEKRLPGVIGAMAIHLQTAADRGRVLKYDSLYIDIGAKDKDEAERECPPGTYAYFDGEYAEFGDGFVCSKALDDRVGCYTLLRALQNEYPCDVTFAFVTQEEVGLRGARGAGFTEQPDIALVCEGTAANDMGDVPEVSKICRAGQGVAVSFMDNGSLANRALFKDVLAVAQKCEVPYQVKRGVTGGNDAAAYQRAGVGARTCVLSVPCRYIHGAASVCKLSDVDAQYALLNAFLTNIGG